MWSVSLYFECSHCPAEISHNAGPQSLHVCFSRKSLRTSSGFSLWCSVFSDVSRKVRTYSLPRSPKQPLQLPPSNRKQLQSWRLRRRLRSLPFIAPWPLLAPTLQVRHVQQYSSYGTFSTILCAMRLFYKEFDIIDVIGSDILSPMSVQKTLH